MPQQRIVVGVDGSASSKSALRWAARQAELTGAAVDAVISWNFPANHTWAMGFTNAHEVFTDDAEKTLSDSVAEALGPEPAVEVRTHVRQGQAAGVLLDAAKDATMLVVGSRGRGGFAGLLLGSVSTACVHHATCPVVVVREDGPS